MSKPKRRLGGCMKRWRWLIASTLLTTLCGCGPPREEEASQNRTIYTVLHPEILASIADADLEQAVVDYVSSKLEGHRDEELKILNSLSNGTRALYLTWMVEKEVNNGGFNQYYWNTRGLYSADAVKAFQYFGADEHAALMAEANKVRKEEAAAISELQERGTPDAFSESKKVSKLGPLDDRFHALTEDLSALRISKIRAGPGLFSGD